MCLEPTVLLIRPDADFSALCHYSPASSCHSSDVVDVMGADVDQLKLNAEVDSVSDESGNREKSTLEDDADDDDDQVTAL